MKTRQGVDQFYQAMFKHNGVFKSLCDILREDLESSKNVLTWEHELLIHRIYFILAYSIDINISDTKSIQQFVKKIILPHFQKNSVIDGCSMFFFEYVRDNDFLLDKSELSYFSNYVLTKIEKLSTSNLSKTVLISTLSRMINYKGFVIEENQNNLLSSIIKKTRKNILINFKDQKVKAQIMEMISQDLRPTTIHHVDVEIIQNRLLYIIALINLLQVCSDKNNSYTQNIC
jgi:hypothetical protein